MTIWETLCAILQYYKSAQEGWGRQREEALSCCPYYGTAQFAPMRFGFLDGGQNGSHPKSLISNGKKNHRDVSTYSIRFFFYYFNVCVTFVLL